MIKDIPEPHRFIINKKEYIINRQYKNIKILYCTLCEDAPPYSRAIDYNNMHSMSQLKKHLTASHDIVFENVNKSYANKFTLIQNTIKCLSYFKEKESTEIMWTCPICNKEFLWIKSTLNYREPYRHIKKHIAYCEKINNRENSEN